MGCNCGSARAAQRAKINPPAGAQEKTPGAWVAVYPDRSERVFTGKTAAREARRRALSSGGRYYQVPEQAQEPAPARAKAKAKASRPKAK